MTMYGNRCIVESIPPLVSLAGVAVRAVYSVE
jgi:hypothetical protein